MTAFGVFGIPSVSRKNAYYLLGTLNSLLKQMTAAEKEEFVFVIFIADSESYVKKVVTDIKADYPNEFKQGQYHYILLGHSTMDIILNRVDDC